MIRILLGLLEILFVLGTGCMRGDGCKTFRDVDRLPPGTVVSARTDQTDPLGRLLGVWHQPCFSEIAINWLVKPFAQKPFDFVCFGRHLTEPILK